MSNKNSLQQPVDKIFDSFWKHPYIFTTLLCLILFPMGFTQAENTTSIGTMVTALLLIIVFSAFILEGKPANKPIINRYLFISTALIFAVFFMLVSNNKNQSVMLFIPFIIILIQFTVVLHYEGTLNTERIIVFLIILGVVLRYCYCLKYGSTEMQHDFGSFDGNDGNLSYINYWFVNGLKLPDFDITTRWQYYHPPLHHMLMAFGLSIFKLLGMKVEVAREAIQILPMIYSALCMVVCYRIFKLVKLEGIGLIIAMYIVCTYRTFIIWSGAYNNDMLCTFFMLSAILCTLKWYQNPSFSKIIPIAFCVGLGMMTKLSAWMVAPAIALLFIWKLIINIKKPLNFLLQYLVFGVICVPLGLWWGIHNLIKFDIPLTYVPDPALSSMAVDKIPVAKRLFDFSIAQFDYPFAAFEFYNAPYNEYNPLIGLIKTSVFDESHNLTDFIGINAALVLCITALVIISFIGCVYMIVNKKLLGDKPTKLFFILIFFTILISYYVFCFKYPYVCTENIRYCIPLIPILAMGLGFLVNKIKDTLTN